MQRKKALLNAALFVAAACLLPAYSWAVSRCEVAGKSVSPYDGSSTAGVTGMMRCKDEATGLLSSERELRGGVFMGLSRFFDASGKIQRERMINERGNTEGFDREFWPNGKLKSESVQANGIIRGAARQFGESGRIERASYTLDSQMLASLSWARDGNLTAMLCSQASLLPEDSKPCGFEGKVQTALFQNGKRRELRVMEQGKILAVTTFRQAPSNGPNAATELLASELTYQNGQRWHRLYSPDGAANGVNLLREERLYEPGRDSLANDFPVNSSVGRLQWSKAWAANAQFTEHIRYANGRPNLTERWYLNGAMKEKITVSQDSGGSRSVRETFNDEGKLTGRQTSVSLGVERPQLTGLQQSFYANGQVATEDTYSKPDEYGRTKLVARKQWDASGKLQSDDEILEDGSRRRSAM